MKKIFFIYTVSIICLISCSLVTRGQASEQKSYILDYSDLGIETNRQYNLYQQSYLINEREDDCKSLPVSACINHISSFKNLDSVLAISFATNSFSNLTFRDLTDELLQKGILEKFSKLLAIDLAFNNLDDDCAPTLKNWIDYTSVQYMYVEGTGIALKQVKKLADGFKTLEKDSIKLQKYMSRVIFINKSYLNKATNANIIKVYSQYCDNKIISSDWINIHKKYFKLPLSQKLASVRSEKDDSNSRQNRYLDLLEFRNSSLNSTKLLAPSSIILEFLPKGLKENLENIGDQEETSIDAIKCLQRRLKNLTVNYKE